MSKQEKEKVISSNKDNKGFESWKEYDSNNNEIHYKDTREWYTYDNNIIHSKDSNG